jgi:hypothetical protein
MRAYAIVQEDVHDLKTFDEYRKGCNRAPGAIPRSLPRARR